MKLLASVAFLCMLLPARGLPLLREREEALASSTEITPASQTSELQTGSSSDPGGTTPPSTSLTSTASPGNSSDVLDISQISAQTTTSPETSPTPTSTDDPSSITTTTTISLGDSLENKFAQVEILLFGRYNASLHPILDASKNETHAHNLNCTVDQVDRAQLSDSSKRILVGQTQCTTFPPAESFRVRAFDSTLYRQNCLMYSYDQPGCKGTMISSLGPLTMRPFTTTGCIGTTNPNTGLATMYIRSAILDCDWNTTTSSINSTRTTNSSTATTETGEQ